MLKLNVRLIALSVVAVALLTSILATKVPAPPAKALGYVISATPSLTGGWMLRAWPRIVIKLANGFSASWERRQMEVVR